MLDVKDAFWGCPLTQDAKLYFALEWEQEVEGKMVKTWTLLLQGCIEAPALLGQAWQKISQEITTSQGLGSCRMWIVQSGGQEEVVEEANVKWLNVQDEKHLLSFWGKKALMVEKKVKYLGHILTQFSDQGQGNLRSNFSQD